MENIINHIKNLFCPQRTKTVLVIDDSDLDRHVATSILEKNFYVLTAPGGREGIEMARAKQPDLILLDFMMPEMKGPEVCHILKGDDRTSHIPVIFLTSMDTPETVVDSFEKGADIYLTKPISRRELVKQVELSLETAALAKE